MNNCTLAMAVKLGAHLKQMQNSVVECNMSLCPPEGNAARVNKTWRAERNSHERINKVHCRTFLPFALGAFFNN